MAETKRLFTTDGPFLAAAVLCEKVLTETDGVLSIIRIVDRMMVRAIGPAEQIPDNLPPGVVDLTAVISFKSGAARGRAKVSLGLEKPSGSSTKLADIPVLFEGEDRGNNLILPLMLEVHEEGLYWIVVELDGELATKLPLRLVYEPVAGAHQVA